MTYEFNADQIEWLHDLETTTEPQITGSLWSPVGWCCLGRACAALSVPFERVGTKRRYEGATYGLPASVVTRLRLRSDIGDITYGVAVKDSVDLCEDLASLNDYAGWTFREIAKFIRENPDKVFES